MNPLSVSITGTQFQGDASYLGDRPDSELTTGEKTLVRSITVQWPGNPSAADLAAFEREYPPHLYPATHETAGGSHRYWRVLILTSDDTATGARELEFRTSPGGADVTSAAFAIAGTNEANANRAFDNAVNSWSFTKSVTNPSLWWIGQDFGAGNEQEIVEISFDQVPTQRGPRTFEVQYSDDGSNWTTSWAETTPGWPFASEARVFTKP